jgi:predicted Zn-dependent peptidase
LVLFSAIFGFNFKGEEKANGLSTRAQIFQFNGRESSFCSGCSFPKIKMLLQKGLSRGLVSCHSLSRRQQARSVSTGPHIFPIFREEFITLRKSPTVKQTILENGMRVLTYAQETPYYTLSLFVNSGTRAETPKYSGSSHFLKFFAFRDSYKKLGIKMIREPESLGCTFSSAFTRETNEYHLSGMATPSILETMIDNLTGAVDPLMDEWDFEEVSRQWVQPEAKRLQECPYTQAFEALHREAFRNQGLGLPLFCPMYQLHHLNNEYVRIFHYRNFTTDRVTIVGNGVDHNELVDYVQDYFNNVRRPEKPTPLEKAKYVGGGEVRIPGHANVHLIIAFEGEGYTSDHWLAANVLQQALGGGNLSSRFKPGNGRTTRIFRDVVLPNSDWLLQANAFHLAYSDVGLFGMYAEAKPGNAAKTFDTVWKTLKSLKNARPTEEEVARARLLLKSNFMMSIEDSRLQLAEHLRIQSVRGQIAGPHQFLEAVDNVKTADVHKVLDKILSSKPIVVAAGDIWGLPRLN